LLSLSAGFSAEDGRRRAVERDSPDADRAGDAGWDPRIWPDERHAVATLIRLGRGKMMGVDHNKNMEWVGASAELWSD